MGWEDRVESQEQEGYLSLLEMLQGPNGDTAWVRSVTELETLDGFELGFDGTGHEVRLQRHVNHRNN